MMFKNYSITVVYSSLKNEVHGLTIYRLESL